MGRESWSFRVGRTAVLRIGGSIMPVNERAECLTAHYERGRLWAEVTGTWKPGDRVPEAVKRAEARVDALKGAAGDGGPDDPLCCQRYGRLHHPVFSVTGCPWYPLRPVDASR